MQRTTVLLLFGGESSEHEVSMSSARNVYAAIDDEKYDVVLGYIDERGRWWLLDTFDEQIDTHGAPQLLPALGSGRFVTMPDNRVIAPDVILPILHGRNGEDGSVQGLAQLLHIPIVGCDMTASVIGMDKVATKELATVRHINIVPYEVHRVFDPIPEFHKLTMTLGSPLFVKPARAGSSVGVSKVFSEEELVKALELAHHHDPVVLIERGIAAREIEVAVLGTPPAHEVTVPGEIIPGEDFYSYDDKYATDSHSRAMIPAEVDESLTREIQKQARTVYESLGCSGLARIDFFLTDDGTLYLNEVNTLPGFTNISMYPKLWRHQGVTYSRLIERLIDDALGQKSATINVEITEE